MKRTRRIPVQCSICLDTIWEPSWDFVDEEAKSEVWCALCEADWECEPVSPQKVKSQQPPRSRKNDLTAYKEKYAKIYPDKEGL